MNNMNNAYPHQLSAQFVQSPTGQYTPQFMTPICNQLTPPWSEHLMNDIQSIKTAVSRIENFEKTVNSICKIVLWNRGNPVNSICKIVLWNRGNQVNSICKIVLWNRGNQA